MNQPTKTGIVPQGPPLQGGDKRYVLTETIMRNDGGSGGYSNRTAEFEITNPSTRLFLVMTIGFMPDTAEDATIPAGYTLSMDAWAKTSSRSVGQGRRIRGNSIIPGPFALPTGLPLSYEAVSGVDQWRGRVTAPATGTGLAVSGWWLVSCTWEPAAGWPDPSDEELRKLFEACRLTPGAGAGITVFSTQIP